METKFGYPQVLVQVKVFEESKILNLLDRVLGGKHKRHKKQGQFAWFCPFCNHYKPKLEVNILKYGIVGYVIKKVVVYLHF